MGDMTVDQIVQMFISLGVSTTCLIFLGKWTAKYIEGTQADLREQVEQSKQREEFFQQSLKIAHDQIKASQDQLRDIQEHLTALQEHNDKTQQNLAALESMIRDKYTAQIDENTKTLGDVAVALKEVTRVIVKLELSHNVQSQN